MNASVSKNVLKRRIDATTPLHQSGEHDVRESLRGYCLERLGCLHAGGHEDCNERHLLCGSHLELVNRADRQSEHGEVRKQVRYTARSVERLYVEALASNYGLVPPEGERFALKERGECEREPVRDDQNDCGDGERSKKGLLVMADEHAEVEYEGRKFWQRRRCEVDDFNGIDALRPPDH